jgi:cysteine desulfurase
LFLESTDMDRIYFDYNATTPLAPEVAQAMQPYLHGEFGNPSSHHWAGRRMHEALERSRHQVATLLSCVPNELIFTSGGTEANNAALCGVFFSQKKSARPQIVISSIEHPSITKTCDFLQRLGAVITRVPVDRCGLVDPGDVRRALTTDTVLVSIMHSNNEVGTLQPICEIAAIAREHQVLMHTDAAQSVGKVPVNISELGVDLLTVAGHKMYAPLGVGALFIREGVTLEPWLHGAGHESGRRAGTENIAAIVGLGAAAELARTWQHDSTIRELSDQLWRRLVGQFGDRVVLNGHPTQRLPNTLNVGFLGHHGYELLERLPNLAASTGSACHAGNEQRSPVLAAMDILTAAAAGAIRFSLGRTSTLAEVEAVISELASQFTLG